MKIKVKLPVETKEIEITFPHYRMGHCHAYAFINEERFICICHGLPNDLSIETHELELYKEWLLKDVECTKEQFNEKYEYVLERINQLKLT